MNIQGRRKTPKYLKKSCYHHIKCIIPIFMAAFMWSRPLIACKALGNCKDTSYNSIHKFMYCLVAFCSRWTLVIILVFADVFVSALWILYSTLILNNCFIMTILSFCSLLQFLLYLSYPIWDFLSLSIYVCIFGCTREGRINHLTPQPMLWSIRSLPL